MRGRVSRAWRLVVIVALLIGLSVSLAAHPVWADDGVRRRGECAGEGDWRLRVDRIDRRTLRVRFRIDDVDRGETWQLFISRNGVRVYSGTKVADDGGEVRVRRRIADRAGTDRIAASGVNVADGTTCQGSVRF